MLGYNRWPLRLKYLALVHGKYGLYALLKKRPRRYRNLFKEIAATKSKVILEIGVYNGNRAVEMIETAKLAHPAASVEYYGFDLFRSLSEEEMKKEFSKQPSSADDIRAKLAPTGAHVELFEGFTTDTLPAFVERMKKEGKTVDFAFIDGGHAYETILTDWNGVRELMHGKTVVVFDDHYREKDAAALGGVGCQRVIADLNPSVYRWSLYPEVDKFARDFGELQIRFARVVKA